MNKEERIRTFMSYVKGVLNADIPDHTKIEVIEKEIRDIEGQTDLIKDYGFPNTKNKLRLNKEDRTQW